jgi:phosphatidylethanolamine-binding protein (PEBP) family uncharacterized protein
VLSGLALSAACAGCGGAVAAKTARSRPKPIALTSPSMAVAGVPGAVPKVPVRYTCDGSDTTPSFRWGPVPSGTAELALFMLKVNRSTPSGGRGGVRVSVEWALAGLSPSTHAIPAGKLPPGAIAAGKPYTICPAKGSVGTYIFQLSAISQRLPVAPHFDPTRLFVEAEGSTVASGTFASLYKRA